MIRFLINTAIFLATSALGLLAAHLILSDVTVSLSGFVIAVVVFAIAQSILAPFVLSMARKYAQGLLGGIGLVSTFLALWIATLFPGGIQIRGVVTWVLATLIIWIVTAIGTWLLPMILIKDRVTQQR